MAGTICQLPDQPGIDGTKENFPLFSPLLSSRNLVQNPSYLGRREIGIDDQTCLLMEEFRIAILLELVSDMGCLARLPNDGIVDRKTSFLVPDNCCFPLVGNADAFDLIRTDTAFDKGACDD